MYALRHLPRLQMSTVAKNFAVTMNGASVNFSTVFKLGVKLDVSLSYNDYMQYITAKVSQKSSLSLEAIQQVDFINFIDFMDFIKSTLSTLLLLEYCDVTWHGCGKITP